MKTVVVTGSTRGIGRGLAENFLKRGCKVCITGRKQEDVDAVVAALAAQFDAGNVIGTTCEVSDLASVQALWDFALAGMGSIDIWINNAGYNHARKSVMELSESEIRAVVDSNLTGLLFACKVAVTGMTQQGHGQVWNMEGFGSNGMVQAGMVTYGATKRAVNYLNKALRKDTADCNVQICTLSPGIVLTDMLIGEYDRSSDEWERVKRMFNILADKVETVTPWLVDGVLKADKDGAKVTWLTNGKVMKRFLLSRIRKRDLFADSES